MDYKEFRAKIIKRSGPFKIRNAFNIYQIYKYIRKRSWYDIGRPVTEKEFYSIIRSVNKYLADNLVHGESVTFPSRMGMLELRKYEPYVGIKKNGKLSIGYPIDWGKTLRLWFEDEEAKGNKTLVRNEDKLVFRIKYDKFNATYDNKVFYDFRPHKKVKQALKECIKSGKTDTLW